MVTSQRAGALRVPNAALRYHPSSEAATAPKLARSQVPLVSEAWADTAPPADGETRPGTRRVFAWKLQSGRPVRVPVLTGISDGQRTEVISGLAEGDQVVVADPVPSNGGKHGPF
jgi:HlyD family secretion protein